LIQAANEDDYIKLIFRDNGLGIDLSTSREKLFSLYHRFHTHVEGKGMGLYLVKTQVMTMGGRIEVFSEVNQGTTFHVYLKRK
jgi:signal transduction histidine kinase